MQSLAVLFACLLEKIAENFMRALLCCETASVRARFCEAGGGIFFCMRVGKVVVVDNSLANRRSAHYLIMNTFKKRLPPVFSLHLSGLCSSMQAIETTTREDQITMSVII